MHEAMRVFKTWVNSWHTSDRYHESVRLPCLFGCAGSVDKLAHYVMCPYLFDLIKRFYPLASPCPVERLGLVNPSRDTFLCMACTFGGYHAVRRFVATELASVQPDSELNYLHPNFPCTFALDNDSRSLAVGVRIAFCGAFWADAIDCKLKCIHYKAHEDIEQLLSSFEHITDTFEGNSIDGITVRSDPPVGASSACNFVRASDANAHNPLLQQSVQITPATPVRVQEIPPSRVDGGAEVFSASVG